MEHTDIEKKMLCCKPKKNKGQKGKKGKQYQENAPYVDPPYEHVNDLLRDKQLHKTFRMAKALFKSYADNMNLKMDIDDDIERRGWIRFVCISDTHSKHQKIELPRGDVLIHAGKF